MRAVVAEAFGGPEVLKAVDLPEPVVAEGRVLVRVTATTVNPVDQGVRAGAFAARFPQVQPPLVLGWDFAGVVAESGGGWAEGTRVAGLVPWFTTLSGTYAERIAVDPSWLAAVPAEVPDVEAASLPLNGLTALQALALADLPAGRLLVTGASGAVGGFAVELAASAGIEVIAVASAGDGDHVAGLGAARVIVRTPGTSIVDEVRALFPTGVDAVLDAGVAGPSLIDAVADDGAFVTVNVGSAPQPTRGISIRNQFVEPNQDQLGDLLARLRKGGLTTRTADRFALDDAAEAHRQAAGGRLGKLALIP